MQPGHATQALRRTLFYDNYGNPNLIREEAALAPARQTRHDYTGDGYFLRATTNPALHTTSQEIDPKTGNVTLVEDANGQKTDLVYDAMGRPLEERSYDPLGELETILDPELHTIRYVRDDRGRLLTAMDPNAGTRTFVVDGFGDTIESTDANGQHVTHVRDELGRPTERYVHGQLESEWHWDTRKKGALDWERGGSGGASDFCRGYDYDGFGRPRQIATFSGARWTSSRTPSERWRVATATTPSAAPGTEAGTPPKSSTPAPTTRPRIAASRDTSTWTTSA